MGGGLVEATREENVDLMIEVMQDPTLHKQASKGYKYTGTNVALDGSEDWRTCRGAGDFWRALQMRPKVDSAVAEVKAAFERGELPWTYANVQSLITPYPRRRAWDVLLIGQEDEATGDPDGGAMGSGRGSS